MSFGLDYTIDTGNQVTLEWWDQGADTTVSIYRTAAAINNPDDLTEDSLLASGVTGTTWTDYAALASGYYYITDGTNWAASDGAVETAGYAPEIQPDYVPTSLDTVTADAAFIRQVNSSGRVAFNKLSLGTGATKIAVLAIQGTSEQLAEPALAQALKGKCAKFAVLQTGDVKSIAGYGAELSGQCQIKYVAQQ